MAFLRDEFSGKRFGRYEVVCKLAAGGSAEIFLGVARTGPFVGLPLVIKRMLHRTSPESITELIDEAKVTASLSHPNIARIYDIVKAGDDVVLVMEFIPGATLSEVRRGCRKRGELVPLGLTVLSMCDALAGLHHAHCHVDRKGRPKPVVHCDVTPGNLMVDFRGTCRVLDFGIARASGSSSKSKEGMVRGTAAYMSPEQVRGQTVDFRSDLFSLGSVFHEMLTGQVAFGRDTDEEELDAVLEGKIKPPSELAAGLPPFFDDIVMRALAPTPQGRWSTALEMRGALLLSARSVLWSAEECAVFLRKDFAEREGRIEVLMGDIRLTDDPTVPVGSRLRRTQSVETLLQEPTRIKDKRVTRSRASTRKSKRAVPRSK